MLNNILTIIGICFLIALIIFFSWLISTYTGGLNMKRGKRSPNGAFPGAPFVWYDEMTPEERRAAGFIPTNELPPDWKKFNDTHGKLLPNGRLRDPKK